jgi:hypothetical protein
MIEVVAPLPTQHDRHRPPDLSDVKVRIGAGTVGDFVVGIRSHDLGAVQWIAAEILGSRTAQFVRFTRDQDPPYADGGPSGAPIHQVALGGGPWGSGWYLLMVASDVNAEVYKRWIESWIETRWMPSLADYLRAATEALK